jgi:RNA polymerase sigma factor (sigma-70 family)
MIYDSFVIGNSTGEATMLQLTTNAMTTQNSVDSGPTVECLMNRIPQLERFLRSRGFSEFVAEKAIDRVIHAALRYLSDDKSVVPLRNHVSWLFGSALSAARQVASREPVCCVEQDFLESVIAAEPDQATNELIWRALDQLTDPQREAIELTIMHGLTLAEAAMQMDCLPSTVARHRKRGTIRLRRLLSSG